MLALFDSGGLHAEFPVLPPFEKRGVVIIDVPVWIVGFAAGG